ncbi:Uncharacterised protein [Mycobacteroides abscessus subsp. massiliense]|nr:Uncharacterised protein [Mycobacteroides abscessus subsp. massiliense]
MCLTGRSGTLFSLTLAAFFGSALRSFTLGSLDALNTFGLFQAFNITVIQSIVDQNQRFANIFGSRFTAWLQYFNRRIIFFVACILRFI